jgi:hypothetical protein
MMVGLSSKDDHVYELVQKVADEEFDNQNIYCYKFHGDWDYRILPKK